jgi:hypothetical protein
LKNLVSFDGLKHHRSFSKNEMNRDFGLLDETDQHQALRAAVEQAGFVDL